jgi:hypothetical protein
MIRKLYFHVSEKEMPNAPINNYSAAMSKSSVSYKMYITSIRTSKLYKQQETSCKNSSLISTIFEAYKKECITNDILDRA